MSKILDVGDLVIVNGRNYLYRIESVHITCDGPEYLVQCIYPRVPLVDQLFWLTECEVLSKII